LAEVMMRGTDRRSGELFSYVDLEQRVRADHPLRAIRETANAALDALSGGPLEKPSEWRRNVIL
jgi:hypothetical protein